MFIEIILGFLKLPKKNIWRIFRRQMQNSAIERKEKVTLAPIVSPAIC